MKIGAVICELNPFHEGHKYILGEAKKDCDVLIAVMSGNYVQRGENAVFNKYVRAEKAVCEGVDLCLEIPFPFSCSSAEYFAKSGVQIAENAGADTLYFGSECCDKNALIKAAGILNTPEFFEAMKQGRAAEEREKFLLKKYPEIPSSVLCAPNDILAAEYARFSKIDLHPVKRIETASASDIRKILYENNEAEAEYSKLLTLIFNHIILKNSRENVTAEATSGIINRAVKMSGKTNNPNEFLKLLNTKQYTESRIKRTLIYSLMGVKDVDLKENVLFTNVLAMNDVGRNYLSTLRKADKNISFLSSFADSANLSDAGKRQFQISANADRIYTLLSGKEDPEFFVKKHAIIV